MGHTSNGETLAVDVIEAVADEKDIDPADLETPLYDVIDPGSLNSLFQSETGKLEFQYSGAEIEVYASGEIEVETL